MTLEVILLGLASTIRPTSLAAVCALLATSEPRRLMVAYVCAGLAFTVAVGLIVVEALNGIDVSTGDEHAKAIVDLVGGGLLLGLALIVARGRIAVGSSGDAPD